MASHNPVLKGVRDGDYGKWRPEKKGGDKSSKMVGQNRHGMTGKLEV